MNGSHAYGGRSTNTNSGTGKTKRKKKKKKKKNKAKGNKDNNLSPPVVMGFLRRPDSPVSTNSESSSPYSSTPASSSVLKRSPTYSITSRGSSGSSVASSRPPASDTNTNNSVSSVSNMNVGRKQTKSPPPLLPQPNSQQQSQILKLIQQRKAGISNVSRDNNVHLLARRSPPNTTNNKTTLNSNNTASSTMLTPPPPSLPTLSSREVDNRVGDLRRLIQNVMAASASVQNVATTLLVQRLKEELAIQFSHQDDLLREEAVAAVHDCLRRAAAKPISTVTQKHQEQKTSATKCSDDGRTKVFQLLDIIVPVSLRHADDVSTRARDAHVRILRQATAMSLLHQRPIRWSHLHGATKEKQGTGVAEYWRDRRAVACERLRGWSVDADDTSSLVQNLDNKSFARLFDGRMEEGHGVSLVSDIMHRRVPTGRTTRKLLEDDAMALCSRWLCRRKFKSHWGSATKTFEELERNLTKVVACGGDVRTLKNAGKRTLHLVEVMEKHVGLSVSRGATVTDLARRSIERNDDAEEQEMLQRGPKWVSSDFYRKNRVVFSQWFQRLRPLLVQVSTLVGTPVGVLYHGEKHLQEMTTKLRKNDEDAMKLARSVGKNGSSTGSPSNELQSDKLRACEKVRESLRNAMAETVGWMITAASDWCGTGVMERDTNDVALGLSNWASRLEQQVLSHTGRRFDLSDGFQLVQGTKKGKHHNTMSSSSMSSVTLERAVSMSAWEGSLRWGQYAVATTTISTAPNVSAKIDSLSAVADLSWKAAQQDAVHFGTRNHNSVNSSSSATTAVMAHLQLLRSMEESSAPFVLRLGTATRLLWLLRKIYTTL